MVKKTIILLMITVTVMLLLSNVSAYQRLCLTKGQAIPSKQSPRFTCTHDLCEVCVDSKNYPVHPGNCNSISGCSVFGSDTNYNTTIDSQAPSISLTSPILNNVYNQKSVLLTISTNENAKLYTKSNIDPRAQWRSITASYIKSYSQSLTFNEGLNDIAIKAVDNAGNYNTTTIKFYIDTKAPKIKTTLPLRNYASGTFNLTFTEENPVSVQLVYGTFDNLKAYGLNINNECIKSGTSLYSCGSNINLDEYNNQKIQYYYVIEDIAHNKAQSKPITLSVDNQKPVINNLDTMIRTDAKYAYFNISITEQNFKEASYTETTNTRERVVKLCTSLKNSYCYKKLSFSSGYHNIDLKVIDKAGNFIEKNIEFNIA